MILKVLPQKTSASPILTCTSGKTVLGHAARGEEVSGGNGRVDVVEGGLAAGAEVVPAQQRVVYLGGQNKLVWLCPSSGPPSLQSDFPRHLPWEIRL